MLNIYKMNIPMRITNRIAISLAVVVLPICLTAQIQLTAKDDFKTLTVDPTAPTVSNIRVLDNDNAPNRSLLRIDKIPLVNHGTASVSADGQAIEFTPELDFKGIALVNYTITDGSNKYDMGLLTLNVVEAVTPTSGMAQLFVRKGEVLTFMVPTGFTAPVGFSQVLTQIQPDVYRYTSNTAGFVELIFNKYDNGLIKDYRVEIQVLNSILRSSRLKDDYYSVPLGLSKDLNVLANDTIDPTRTLVSLNLASDGNCNIIHDGQPTSLPNVVPIEGFSGVIQINYTLTYSDGTTETAMAYLTVSNFLPAKSSYTLNILNSPLEQKLPYAVPEDFKPYITMIPTATTRGGTLRFQDGELYYTGNPNNSFGYDEFDVTYSVVNAEKEFHVRLNFLAATAGALCTDCVWPGDSNKDGVVDMGDIFPVGANMGQYGRKRNETETTNWQPYFSENWTVATDGQNAKFADLNGDGFINAADTNVVLKNFGNANSIYPQKNVSQTQVAATLTTNITSAQAGQEIEILVTVGNAEFPAVDARGFTFKVTYDNDLIKPNTVRFDFGRNNWLSSYDSYLALSKITSLGQIEAGIVRSRDRGASGHGEVGKVKAIVVDDISGVHIGQDKPTLRFKLEGTMVGKDGKTYTLKVKQDLVIPLKLKKEEAALTPQDVTVFPNPSTDLVTFYMKSANNIESIRIYDMAGREVHNTQNVHEQQTTLDLRVLSAGVYFAKVQTKEGLVVKKFQIVP